MLPGFCGVDVFDFEIIFYRWNKIAKLTFAF